MKKEQLEEEEDTQYVIREDDEGGQQLPKQDSKIRVGKVQRKFLDLMEKIYFLFKYIISSIHKRLLVLLYFLSDLLVWLCIRINFKKTLVFFIGEKKQIPNISESVRFWFR